jgi:hypothetical protein
MDFQTACFPLFHSAADTACHRAPNHTSSPRPNRADHLHGHAARGVPGRLFVRYSPDQSQNGPARASLRARDALRAGRRNPQRLRAARGQQRVRRAADFGIGRRYVGGLGFLIMRSITRTRSSAAELTPDVAATARTAGETSSSFFSTPVALPSSNQAGAASRKT